ncbi:MAG TPA: phosphoribosylanthranilate isomerase [Gemmatimonadaceae bacterium]|nr:phosphoribosylanthranilate isomerase [Gemmatimonadaceae bacterium]
MRWFPFAGTGGMRPDIKFCGLTRPEDAEAASALGARYVGVIFAGGPRNISPERARDVFAAVGEDTLRVGVFAKPDASVIVDAVRTAGLDVVQLHGDATPDAVTAVRDETGCQVWAVVRVAGATLPAAAADLIDSADATLLDAKVDGKLGGTGVALPWRDLADALHDVRGAREIVLAGGLTPANVRDAIDALHPDIVDVSSGVESAPGIKDHERMREFAEAVWTV